jgi:integrase
VRDDRFVAIESSGKKFRAVVQLKGVKRHSNFVPTRAEAKVLEAQLMLSMGGSPVQGAHTVAEVVAGYIADSAGRLSPGTIDFYQKGEKALPATFLARQVADVKPVVVDALYSELRAGGASEHKIQKVHRLLSAAFERALRYEWLASNPCRLATKPRPHTEEIRPPSSDEVWEIILKAALVNEDLGVCLLLAAATGMRRGELVALQWRDIGKGQITIRRSLVEDKSKKLHIRQTKTGTRGHRTIAVDSDTMYALEAVSERHAADALRTGLPPAVWCFTREDLETPWRPDYLTTAYGRLTRESTLHGLRHYHATQLLSGGVAVATVSHRLGHSSAAVTLKTYSHWIPSQDQDAADIIGDILQSAMPRASALRTARLQPERTATT